MTDDLSPAPAAAAPDDSEETPAAEGTTKKTAKKTTKKKSTKKAAAKKKAAKKKTAKKTAKKAAKKKAAKKKAAKKKAAKKSAGDADDETADADDGVDAADSEGDTPDADADASPATKKTKTSRKRRSKKAATADDAGDAGNAEADAGDDIAPSGTRKKPAKKSRSRSRSSGAKMETEGRPSGKQPKVEMLINYVPGEDCRIAVVEDGRLEEFYSEPTRQVSRVGNIYVGKVTNVETQIQAAFVDFGLDEAGFLHVSDLHPRYFPGDADATEKVGRKTPRRQRPPIQQCLKKGQEIIVQVLKEGVGTKGPSLTSYLSIPGRFLVMMPDMDKVGVSRKVDDETERRKMREILDQLDLPDGFGFILRTAGYSRGKDELDRDLAYLRRLWADMETRRKRGGGPRLLYSESDLLVRTLRDQLTADVSRLVIDSEHALARSGAFLQIVSPQSRTKLELYDGSMPIFHAFGIEDQIALMHATEVPLPSGGRLVIEQTEALVAIDVNSGRSRKARDAETNALNTNLEAVEEICRQLRLRDLGGLVINDLIDMRPAANRRKVENLFQERLRRDRAKSTILPISEFGILEMTRQRMRGSYEQQHFQTCPSCSGRGLVQRPDSVAADALRELASVLDHDRVAKVELVVSPRVAGALLSTRRAGLGRIERATGKAVEVRISESISSGRVAFYAYDANGADIDISRLPKRSRKPTTKRWADTPEAEADAAFAIDTAAEAEAIREEEASEAAAHDDAKSAEFADIPLPGENAAPAEDEGASKKKRRRRRRGKRRGEGEGEGELAERAAEASKPAEQEIEAKSDAAAGEDIAGDGQPSSGDGAEGEGGKKKRRRRRRRRRRSGDEDGQAEQTGERSGDEQSDATEPAADESASEDDGPPDTDHDDDRPRGKKKRRRRGRRRSGGDADEGAASGTGSPSSSERASSNGTASGSSGGGTPDDDKPKRRRRGLYGAGRRTLSPSEKARMSSD